MTNLDWFGILMVILMCSVAILFVVGVLVIVIDFIDSILTKKQNKINEFQKIIDEDTKRLNLQKRVLIVEEKILKLLEKHNFKYSNEIEVLNEVFELLEDVQKEYDENWKLTEKRIEELKKDLKLGDE